jgi:uncharacterized protein (TIGR00251 family)
VERVALRRWTLAGIAGRVTSCCCGYGHSPAPAATNGWGLWDDRFRVRIAAPPVDGRANAHLRAFLAELFGVAKNQVTLLAGETGRDKRWRIVAPKQLPPGIAGP